MLRHNLLAVRCCRYKLRVKNVGNLRGQIEETAMTDEEILKELKMMHSYFHHFDDDRSARQCQALQRAINSIEREIEGKRK